MNISIVGYGKMGQLVEEAANQAQVNIQSIIDPLHPNATHKSFSEESMKDVDVCICFTEPKVALANIEDACKWKKQLVMATTGWVDAMPQVKKMVDEAGIGMVYSSNFSLGVNLFFKIVEQAGKIMNLFDVYDVMGLELHHNRKQDSPSGTARTIAEILVDQIDRKTVIAEEKMDRKIEANELHFASVRGGDIPGTHSVMFDSSFDTIELKHTARNRRGFASGSVVAAKWIQDKKGLFTESDMMNALLG